MRVVTSYSNFARASVDHDFQGRYDLPIYQTSAPVFQNCISNFKGNAIYRAAFEALIEFQDCAFIEYKFSGNQNYILVLYNLKMRFLSYDINGDFGWVLSGGVPLEVTTPYTLAESKEIAFRRAYAQNFDVMIITHEDHEPRKLIRTAANAFTFRVYSRKDDPFLQQAAAAKTVTAITKATSAQITVAAHGYAVGDRVRIGFQTPVVGMTQINNWTGAVLTVPDANNFTIDVDSTAFTAYSSAGSAEKITGGDYPSVALFYKGRLCYAASRLKITTVWMSESAQYFIHTLPATVLDTSALQFTIAEITQRIEWLAPGSNSLVAGAGDGIVTINGGAPGESITAATVEASITSADGCNGTEPLIKDGFLFYVGNSGRNLYYFNYDVLTETFNSQDANFISYDISAGEFNKIRYTKDRNNLIHCLRAGDLCTVNFNVTEKIIGWHEHFTEGQFKDIAQISDNEGNQKLFALVLRNGTDYFIEKQAPYVEFALRSDFFTDDKAADDEAYYRYVAEQLKSCIYLDNSTTFSDFRTSALTYDSVGGTITDAGASFTAGDVGKHIVYKTLSGYESGRFLITDFQFANFVAVSVLQEPTSDVYASGWYLTFNELTGLSRFDGVSPVVGVVTDGGFLGDYETTAGVIALPEQVTHAVAGYRYSGKIKSFPLGFAVQGENTQATMKAIFRVGLRTVNSVGGKFGTSPYKLEAVQEMGQTDLNYLPPLPMDGTKYVTYVDDNELDKCFYIVQDEPGPFQTSVVMIDSNYAVTR